MTTWPPTLGQRLHLSSVSELAGGTLAGALPANDEATLVGAGVASEDLVSQMLSTTELSDGANDGVGETPAAPASGSAALGPSLVAPGSIGSVIPVMSLVHMLETVDFGKMETDEIAEVSDMVHAAKSNYAALCQRVIDRGEAALAARMKADGGRALPSWDYEIKLVEQFTPYAFDDQKLRDVMGMLKPADAARLGRVIPARTETITVPETFERGKTVSIQALIDQYGENSPVGKALKAAMTRSKTGEKVFVKRIAPDPKTIDGAAL